MMALFIVLWLMSADKEVQQAISAYFNNPSGPGKMTGSAAAGPGNALEIPKQDMSKLREKIQDALKTVPNFRDLKDHVEITITSEGCASSSSRPKPACSSNPADPCRRRRAPTY